ECWEHRGRELAPPSAVVPAQPGTHNPRAEVMGPGSPPAGAGVGRDDGGSPAPRPELHDVPIEIRRRRECARAEGVTPEEFGISRRARSIKDTDYCFHD